MDCLVINPNLPGERVRAVIIGHVYAPLLEAPLEALGIRTVKCPPNPVVDPRLSCHPDLSVLHLGGEDIFVSRHVASELFLKELSELGLSCVLTDAPWGSDYPRDAALCAAIVGGKVFHNPRVHLPELLRAGDREAVSVRQGYVKCALCPVTENALMTGDPGIAKTALALGMQVLLIEPGHIVLEGFDYGFIGGCAFKSAPDTLVFTGHLNSHPDRDRIEDFLKGLGVKPAFLTEEPVFDVGSILPIADF